MKHSILTLGFIALGLTVAAQNTAEQKLSDSKNTRVVKVYSDDTMTDYELRYDDTSLLRNYYDKSGNLVLESTYSFGGYFVNNRYEYNDKNQLIADSIDTNSRHYAYNEDGTLKYKIRFDNRDGAFLDSIHYEYIDGKISDEIIFNNKKAEINRYTYTYSNGLLSKREYKNSSSGKISSRVEYKYDSNNNLIEEIEYAISTSSSTLGNIKSAARQQYTYDSSNRLIEQLYSEASASNGVLGEYTNKNKIIITYNQLGQKIKSDKYVWDSKLSVWDHYDFNVYTYSTYSKDYMPQNFKVSEGSAITKIKIDLDKPTILDNFKGYKIIADDQILDTLYTTESFEVEKQLRGVHRYRAVAMYDTIAGNTTDELIYNMDIFLPTPSNGQVITKEYTTQWNVSFKWDAPQTEEGVNLIGYRYYMSGCNGALNGFYPGIVVDGADQTKGTLLIYPNSVKENNIATIYLSAIYEEGESDIYSFEIDLRDTSDQIIAHWQNERYDISDADGYFLGSKRFYYTSSSSGNSETQICSIDYDDINQPQYRYIRTSDGNDAKYAWNKETMQWDNYELTQYQYNIKTDMPGIDFIDQSTLKRIDPETGDYKNISVAKQYKYYTPSYSVIHEITRYYDFDENGQEIYMYMDKHSSDGDLKIDTRYHTDEKTIFAKKEFLYKRGKIISETYYEYINDNYIKVWSKEYEYSNDTDLCIAFREYEFDGNNKVLVRNNNYIASKEYHYTKTPFNLKYKSGVLSWSKPSGAGINPTGYKVFVNYTEYATTTETSIEIDNVPTGSHIFTVMCLFDDAESSMSAERKSNHVNYASFIPTTVDPAPYDAEIDNYVNTLSKVTLIFPSKVASMDETIEASFNSRFMTYSAPATLAEDGLSVTFSLPEDLENGMYFLSIPAKMFNSEESTYNPELNYTFLLQLPMTTDLPKPSVNPAEGELTQLESFELTFDQDVYALESLIGIAGSVYVEDAAKNKYDTIISAVENFDYTKWTLTLNGKLTTEGKYTLVIPEATFGDSTASASSYSGAFTTGKVNPQYTFNYTITDAAVDEIELNNTIKVEGNSIIAPQGTKVFNSAGIEVKPNNLPIGVYVVVINNEAIKVVVK